MSRTTFQLPSFCSFQMLVYLPYCTIGRTVFFFGVEFVVAVGVTEIARSGDVGAHRRPGEAITLVVEKAHSLGDLHLALDQGCAVRDFDRVVGVIRHISLGAFFGGRFHELAFELLQHLSSGFR